MSSRRLPGKVLAPFRGRPLVAHVIERVRDGLGSAPVVLVTSVHPTDDPLAAYARTLDVPVFRGPLDDVFGRFRAALDVHPCTFVMRVCCDSPLLLPTMVRDMAQIAREGAFDVVTTTHPRTFPSGQNVEVIRTRTMLAIHPGELDAHDREHVTRFFYRHPMRFTIKNVESGDANLAEQNDCVDTLDDLVRLEAVGGT